MRRKRLLPQLFALTLASAAILLGAGCGDSDCNSLAGAVKTAGYDLHFTRVEIKRQLKGEQLQAMLVNYVDGGDCSPSTGVCSTPVKIVANAPVEKGAEHDLVTGGAIQRIVSDQSQFKDLREGFIRFDKLGGDAAGKFYGTFVDGLTINGEFCGGVIDLQN